MQTGIVSGKSLCLTVLAMKDVAHDHIKVGHQVGRALAVDLSHSAAELFERGIFLMLHIVRHTAKVIEHHLFWIVVMSSLRQANDLIIIFLFPEILNELDARLTTVGSYLEHLAVSGIDRIHRHLLNIHIGSPELSDVCRGLGLSQHSVEKSDDLG